jgi:topoisomerase IA-like protein
MALFKLKNFSYVDYNQALGEGPSIQYMITIDNTEYGPYILDQDNKIGTEEINLSFINIGTTDAE